LKIRDLGLDSPGPQVRRQTLLGRNSALRKVAEPFSPRRSFTVREIKGVHDGPSLPTVVRRRISVWEGIAGIPRMSNPEAVEDDRVNVG
jgi:hypothetical protein